MTQAQVTDWPTRIALVLAMLAFIGIALAAMRRGWLGRRRRQAGIVPPAQEPPTGTVLGAAAEGLYVGAATAGDWLDRIAAHGLGVRSRATMRVGVAGVWFDRVGAPGAWLPRAELAGARLDRGVAGTVRGRDSVIVLTWAGAGQPAIDLGFRADDAAGHRLLLDGLAAAGLDVNGADG